MAQGEQICQLRRKRLNVGQEGPTLQTQADEEDSAKTIERNGHRGTGELGESHIPEAVGGEHGDKV